MPINARDEQISRDVVKRVLGTSPLPTRRQSEGLQPLPVLAKAKNNVLANAEGTFILQSGRPGSLEDTSVERDAYAVCPITSRETVKLVRMGGALSDGYWLAEPCRTGVTNTQIDCPEFDGGRMTVPVLAISGLIDVAALAQFTGWFPFVNGTHQLTELEQNQATGLCAAEVRITTKDNGAATNQGLFPSGELLISFLPLRENVGLTFRAGRLGETDRATATVSYNENPATPYPRNSVSGLLLDDQTYSTWSVGPTAPKGLPNDLKTWLANGTFTIYP